MRVKERCVHIFLINQSILFEHNYEQHQWMLPLEKLLNCTHLILQRNIAEEIRHGLLIVYATYSLGNQNGNVNCFDFMTL